MRRASSMQQRLGKCIAQVIQCAVTPGEVHCAGHPVCSSVWGSAMRRASSVQQRLGKCNAQGFQYAAAPGEVQCAGHPVCSSAWESAKHCLRRLPQHAPASAEACRGVSSSHTYYALRRYMRKERIIGGNELLRHFEVGHRASGKLRNGPVAARRQHGQPPVVGEVAAHTVGCEHRHFQ